MIGFSIKHKNTICCLPQMSEVLSHVFPSFPPVDTTMCKAQKLGIYSNIIMCEVLCFINIVVNNHLSLRAKPED